MRRSAEGVPVGNRWSYLDRPGTLSPRGMRQMVRSGRLSVRWCLIGGDLCCDGSVIMRHPEYNISRTLLG
jgi:hypothetical protein